MYENAQYIKNSISGKICAISIMIDGRQWSVPLDPANSDYAAIMALVAEGELTIAEAE